MKISTDYTAKRCAPQFAPPQELRARVLARGVSFLAALSLPFLASGCAWIEPPDIKEPAPLPAKPTGVVFSADDHITKGVSMEGQYRVREVLSGELLTIEGVTRGEGDTLKGSGVFQTIRLAGIVAPQPGERGWEGSVKTVRNWTQFNRENPTVELESDSKFPIDLDGRAMMQVYFKGTSEKTKNTRYNLNRMMVRSGWAVVDLNVATSIDLQQWLNDEEYARSRNLGLRKYGILLKQRLPSDTAKTAGARRIGAGSAIVVAPGTTTTTTTGAATTTTAGGTSTTTTSTVTSPMPGAPMTSAGGNATSGMAANGVAR